MYWKTVQSPADRGAIHFSYVAFGVPSHGSSYCGDASNQNNPSTGRSFGTLSDSELRHTSYLLVLSSCASPVFVSGLRHGPFFNNVQRQYPKFWIAPEPPAAKATLDISEPKHFEVEHHSSAGDTVSNSSQPNLNGYNFNMV